MIKSTVTGARMASRTAALLMSAILVVIAAIACNGDGEDGASGTVTSTQVAGGPTTAPDAGERLTLRGNLTLDGLPLDAQFLGVRVIRNGLAAACQNTIPAVTQGRYEITVAADTEVRGCGALGAELLLWTYAKDRFIFASQMTPWRSAEVTLNASFSSGNPAGASRPATEFKGHVYDRGGRELPGGTVVEAFVGEVRCAITSLRYGSRDPEGRWYTLIVAGPRSVSGCTEGGLLTFRINGEPAAETAVNDLGRTSEGHELNLTMR